MKLSEILDKMYETNGIFVMERPETIVFNGLVKNITKCENKIDISREVLSIRPLSSNVIKIWLENK